MTDIIRATSSDAKLLVEICKKTFIESHGKSAPKADIDAYVAQKFDELTILNELEDTKNYFYIMYFEDTPVGYSKLIFDCSHENIPYKNVTKMERLYLLENYHHLKLGLDLFRFNVVESKKQNQAGIWLFTWMENTKAIHFYTKNGFEIIGSHDFKISNTHYNPNHQMLLTY